MLLNITEHGKVGDGLANKTLKDDKILGSWNSLSSDKTSEGLTVFHMQIF